MPGYDNIFLYYYKLFIIIFPEILNKTNFSEKKNGKKPDFFFGNVDPYSSTALDYTT